jgi:2-polyprenyl-3-methyl-5-hydroxy-6-metoxy-1,4-benzoquinol methylase
LLPNYSSRHDGNRRLFDTMESGERYNGLRKKLAVRWRDMEKEERQQEELFFSHFVFGERLKDFETGFFLDNYKNFNPLVSCFSWKKIHIFAKYMKMFHDTRSEKILDVGCGCGFFLAKLGAGEHHYGVDISRIFLKGARKYAPWAELIHSNAKSLPFEDAFFDAVVCNDVLEHIPHPDMVVKEIKRVTKPGKNRIFISFPNEFNSRIGRLIAFRFPIKWPFHINSLDLKFLQSNLSLDVTRIISLPFDHLPWRLSLSQIFIF